MCPSKIRAPLCELGLTQTLKYIHWISLTQSTYDPDRQSGKTWAYKWKHTNNILLLKSREILLCFKLILSVTENLTHNDQANVLSSCYGDREFKQKKTKYYHPGLWRNFVAKLSLKNRIIDFSAKSTSVLSTEVLLRGSSPTLNEHPLMLVKSTPGTKSK